MSKSIFSPKPSTLISVLIPAHQSPELLEQNIPRLISFFSKHYPDRYEVILIPNPVLDDQSTLAAARKLAKRHPEIRVCKTAVKPGKGLALKEGFGMSRGRWIFTTDADLPYDLDFFLEADRLLGLGFHLVTGNRRLPASRFRMTVQVLGKVYHRVLLGLLFNQFVRFLLPIRTTDTQAGIKALTREAADQVFRHQVCPRFVYDVEMMLTVQGMGGRITELPVTLHLRSEKSTVRIFKSAFHATYWLYRIFLLRWKGHYARPLPA